MPIDVIPKNPPNDGILFVDHSQTGRSGNLGHALVEYEDGKILAFYLNCSDDNKGHKEGIFMLKIRRYQASDHNEVWNLHNLALDQVGANAGSGAQDNDLHTIEETYIADKGEFLAGFCEEKLVAMGALQRISDDKAEIKRMRVHPDFQRRGFGQTILNRLEMRADDLGYKILCLDTTVQQIAARKLYKKNGYCEIERQKISGFDVIFFEKRL